MKKTMKKDNINKKMKLPNIDLKQLKKQKEEDLKERLEFIDMYTEWLKKQPNKKWSSQQKDIINL